MLMVAVAIGLIFFIGLRSAHGRDPQDAVFDALRKSGAPLSAAEIARRTDLGAGILFPILDRLVEAGTLSRSVAGLPSDQIYAFRK